MLKKQFKIFRRFIFYLPLIFAACLVCYLWLSEPHEHNQEKLQRETLSVNSKYSLTSFLLSPNKNERFNRKTPRALFAKFINENLIMWSGYLGNCFQAIDCFVPGKYNKNDNDELEINLKKCQMLMLPLMQSQFKYGEIPLSSSQNTLKLTLGFKDKKNTFYIEKGKDGNWFFTEENFKSSKIIKLYNNFVDMRLKSPVSSTRESTFPLAAYVNFMLGCMEKYDFTLDDASKILGLNKVPKIIRKRYRRFIAFILFKVLTSKNIGFTTITSEPLDSKIEVLYVKSGVGSIYLEKKIIGNKTGAYKWIFPSKALKTAYKIYVNDLMITAPNDPLFFKIQHWVFKHFKFLQNKLFGIIIYRDLLMFFFGIYLLFFVYKLLRKIIEVILHLPVITSKNYQTYAKRLSIYSALIIVLFVFDYLFTSTLMFYYKFYIYFVYAITILYMVLFIFWLCEILNIISSVISIILERKGNKGFRAGFVVDIIRRICSILIVIILIGMLLNKLGVNMLNFLTALGIGGLAVAFAGKDTIENLFGSIMIALEKPFKIGDWIIIGDIEGNVEHVGLRSTRIRTFEDSFLTMPNVKFITSSVNNMGDRTYRRYTTTLDLEDSTPTGLIKSFTAGITELIKKTPSMRKNEYYIRVNDVGESSIKILVYVFFVTLDWANELKERESFILNILRLAEELGIKFAYPTQTLLLSKFKGTENKHFLNTDFKKMNKSTLKAEKTARKIIDKFKLKPPKDPSQHDH
jgi:MscS family membrane protein